MADENVFAADPERIKSGGNATGNVADLTGEAADRFADATAYDMADPPWGNDSYGNQYIQNYIPVHTMLRNGIRDLSLALESAARLTLNSGRSFETAKSDNMDNIRRGSGGPDVHRV
ncbi:hypothetical protein [Streptomyces sp. NPDC060184]|uniref:hypothetical protein n=1 Tax=Streptomyces sp. NPDC060184 TaxID=3347064 RepID=UPI00365749A9